MLPSLKRGCMYFAPIWDCGHPWFVVAAAKSAVPPFFVGGREYRMFPHTVLFFQRERKLPVAVSSQYDSSISSHFFCVSGPIDM